MAVQKRNKEGHLETYASNDLFLCLLFFFFFLLPLPYYRKVMEVLFSVKIFDVEFTPDLYVVRFPESQKK